MQSKKERREYEEELKKKLEGRNKMTDERFKKCFVSLKAFWKGFSRPYTCNRLNQLTHSAQEFKTSRSPTIDNIHKTIHPLINFLPHYVTKRKTEETRKRHKLQRADELGTQHMRLLALGFTR